MPDQSEEIKDYVFTFTQGSELKNYYVIIRDTFTSARNRMCAIFGDRWAFQYADKAKDEVEKYNLTCLIKM